MHKLEQQLHHHGNKTTAQQALRYFKTGPGEYAEHDQFLGIRSGQVRQLIKPYLELSLAEVKQLLQSRYHEVRQAALMILVHQYQRTKFDHSKLFHFYCQQARHINNWDLVDISAPHVFGAYLQQINDASPCYDWAQAKNLWRRRIAVVGTYAFTQAHHYKPTLAVSQQLLTDHEDLIHKACGWMLREVGKREIKILQRFLDQHLAVMPRTMLRYAIEKFPEQQRLRYLQA